MPCWTSGVEGLEGEGVECITLVLCDFYPFLGGDRRFHGQEGGVRALPSHVCCGLAQAPRFLRARPPSLGTYCPLTLLIVLVLPALHRGPDFHPLRTSLLLTWPNRRKAGHLEPLPWGLLPTGSSPLFCCSLMFGVPRPLFSGPAGGWVEQAE